MAMTKSIPEGVQAVFPMLVCQSPEAEMNFCAAAFDPSGHVWTVASRIEETTEEQRAQRWSGIREER